MSHIFDQGGGAPSYSAGGSFDTGITGRFGSSSVSTTDRLGVKYPSPFFDLATTYMPKSIKQLFAWCAYYFRTHPLIHAVVFKMAEYPVTKLIVEDKSPELVKWYLDLAENQLQLRKLRIELNLDYFAFGEAFLTISFPFDKYIVCPECGEREGGYKAKVSEARGHYKWRSNRFYLTCPHCGYYGVAKTVDHYKKDIKGINLVRWSPEYIDVEYNHLTGKSTYYHTLPDATIRDIFLGKRSVIETVPDVYLEAARLKKSIVFANGTIFHLKRPTLAQGSMGRGASMIMPVLKDVFYLQILRKAQESVAQSQIVPLNVLFPNAGDGLSSPYATTNLGAWRDRVEQELARWRLDPGYIPVLPLPIGHQLIGGQGRALILHQEIRVISEQIVAGMTVPNEFIFGGLQYTGSNVSMRMLENSFLGLNSDHLMMVRDFILRNIAEYMEWPFPSEVRFDKFKMADDLQRLMVYFQANQAQKISDSTLLREMGESLEHEEELKKLELKKQLDTQREMQLASADLAGRQQLIQMQYQQKAMAQAPPGVQVPPAGAGSSAPQPDNEAGTVDGMPGGSTAHRENAHTPGGVPLEAQSPLRADQAPSATVGGDIRYFAQRAASYLRSLPPEKAHQELNLMKTQNPNLHALVLQMLRGDQGSNQSTLSPTQMPLPEQKPPRRAAGNALV